MIIDDYFEAKAKVHKLFGYVSDWTEMSMEDYREYDWMLVKDRCVYGEKLDEKNIKDGNHYSGYLVDSKIYTTDVYTMIPVDTESDGNKFLMIFDAKREVTDEKLKELYEEYW